MASDYAKGTWSMFRQTWWICSRDWLRRTEPAGQEPSQRLTTLFDWVLLTIDGKEHYSLRQELQQCWYRNVVECPYNITMADQHKIKCSHEPSKFADFVDELLDPAKREQRAQLISDALTTGFIHHGRTIAELQQKKQEFHRADMVADQERWEELVEEQVEEQRLRDSQPAGYDPNTGLQE